MSRQLLRLSAFVATFILVVASAMAQVPQQVSYQGLLTDSSNIPVPNGTYAMTITLYDASTGGSALWNEVHPSVRTLTGLFDVLLGSVTPLTLPFDKQYWLAVSINGGPELAPRTPLTSAAYSYRSAWADSAAAVAPGSIVTESIADGAVTNQKLSAAGSTPGQVLVSAGDSVVWGAGGGGVNSLNTLTGDVTLRAGSGTTITRSGQQITISAAGLTSINSIDAALAVTDPTGPAVTLSLVPLGITEPLIGIDAVTSSKIRNNNVQPRHMDTTGAAIGQSMVYTGAGVAWGNPVASGLLLPFSGFLNDPAPGISVDNAGTGMGLYGIHSATTGVNPGVQGSTNSSDANATAVVGLVTSTTPGGFSSGVRGINNGTGGLGIGVYGSQNGSGWGVYGTTPSGIGVFGNSSSGFGLYGQSNSSTAVYGTSTNGPAAIFEILNNANTNNALSANTNGAGNAISGTNTGTGRAGNFVVNNAASTASTVVAANNGAGDAVSGTNTGTGRGAVFAVNNAASTAPTVEATNDGGGDAVIGMNTGTGRAGYFVVNNAASAAASIEAMNDGTGNVVDATSTGTGSAGSFAINNGANSASAVSGTTDGTGSAGSFAINNGANSSDAVTATTNGTGSAGYFNVNNPATTVPALESRTNGTATNASAIYGFRASSTLTLGISRAILGENSDGAGVAGLSNTGIGSYGASNGSDGMFGVSLVASFAGVHGRNDVTGGFGVWGQSAGGAVGVYGLSQTGNAGQFDITNTSSTADAVRANHAGLGRAVYGQINNTSNIVAAVRGETNGGGYGVQGLATGNGNAGFFQISNPSSTSSVMNVTTNGIGSGITVQLTNASNGARGLDVLQAGVGPGVFATSAGGNAVWGITSSISAAGVIGDNTFGEAVVGRNRGGNGVGAVVGRNDSSGYGVRGFNTKNGIGVLGQAGISGGTGVGGRFENVNAANGNDALQAATNGTGWAGNFTNANNSSASRGVRITTTAGQGGNALTVANGTVAMSYQHPYASNTVIDDATLVVTTAGNVTVPTGPPLVDGATVWVVNNAGAVITVTNTTVGAFNINPGRAVQLLFVSTVSGANWIPVQP